MNNGIYNEVFRIDCEVTLKVSEWDGTQFDRRTSDFISHFFKIEFAVPFDWAVEWVRENMNGMSIDDFPSEYTYDDTNLMYANAKADGVLIEAEISCADSVCVDSGWDYEPMLSCPLG